MSRWWKLLDVGPPRTWSHGELSLRDLSAMDGYAIRASDAPGPWRVVGESAAGRRFAGDVGAGEAVRIFTGAVVPQGADCVLIQENAHAQIDVVTSTAEAPVVGKHVRTMGSDFCDGEVLVREGEHWSPPRIALASMGGRGILPVRRRLRAALISTGDELVPPGEACAEDQIPSSNATMLAVMLAGLPVDVDDRDVIRDDLVALKAEFEACAGHDIIISIGGASVGDHDLVRPAFEAAGAQLDFWRIAMRPGKPVMAGMLEGAVVLGLPGNPVSAYVTAMLLLLPLVAHLSGSVSPLPARIEAKLATALPANGNRKDHIRAVLHGSIALPNGSNDSSMLAALSASNILIIREINAPGAAIGDIVECIQLRCFS
jgi:molybdopterin molybdotransferase